MALYGRRVPASLVVLASWSVSDVVCLLLRVQELVRELEQEQELEQKPGQEWQLLTQMPSSKVP